MILHCPLCSHDCPSLRLSEVLRAARHNNFSKQYLTDNLPCPSNSDFFFLINISTSQFLLAIQLGSCRHKTFIKQKAFFSPSELL